MKCYGVTDKGLVRKANQDSYIISANAYGDVLAIVADGIGGGKAGDVASTMATANPAKADQREPVEERIAGKVMAPKTA